MINIKLIFIILILGYLFMFFGFWFLSDAVFHFFYFFNSTLAILGGFLMMISVNKSKDIIEDGKKISKSLLDLSLDGIYIEDEYGNILDCNVHGHEMLGYTKEEILTMNNKDFIPDESIYTFPVKIPDNMATGNVYVEKINKKKDGTLFYVEVNSKFIYIDGEKRFIVFMRDITERKNLEKNLIEISLKDELTKIYNRKYIIDQIKNEIFLTAYNNYCFSMALLDIDDFKKVNDSFGHLFGDEVLIKFSNIITKNIRETDLFGRIGGEEFIIIFPNTPLKKSYGILARIKKSLNSALWEKRDFKITFSAGLTQLNYEEAKNFTYKEAIKLVDDLMYQAKTSGKNKILYSK